MLLPCFSINGLPMPLSNILISACLYGLPVRYNGSEKARLQHTLRTWRDQQRLVVFCPELAAGFDTPRPPAEIQPQHGRYSVLAAGARVQEQSGADVTERYLLGAWLALEMAQANQCRFALLTDGSPSCGSQRIYDGGFHGQTLPGMGVTTELLRRHGIEVFSDRQLPALMDRVAAADRTSG
jgi:uncharacterized protein YbbK (DUF523 family)